MSVFKCIIANTPVAKNESLSLDKDEKEKMALVPYANAVGSLMYARMCTRPDICSVIGLVSRFQSNPRLAHWKAVKRILRYLKGTTEYILCYQGSDLRMIGYSDADWDSDLNERKSTSRYDFLLNNGAIT